jgi:hypothetical protein
MRESVDWLHDQKRRRELKAVEQVFKFRLEAAAAAYHTPIDVENIEELFSLASASGGDTADGDYVPAAIAATLDYAKATRHSAIYRILLDKNRVTVPDSWEAWDSDAPQGESYLGDFKIPVYDLYAGVLSGLYSAPIHGMRNTVITFNYDTLLEDALTRLRVPFNYRLPLDGAAYDESAVEVGAAMADRGALQVLKPHGSVNWSARRQYLTELNLTVYRDYAHLMAAGGSPYLLPPTWRKIFAGALTSVWNSALQAIREATRIVIIGFSMPRTDVHFKYLLAAGLKDNVSLRDLVFINIGDCSSLKENLSSVFQPTISDRIRWWQHGVQQTLMDREFLRSIERDFMEGVGQIEPYN